MLTLNKYIELHADEFSADGPSYSDENRVIASDTFPRDKHDRLERLCDEAGYTLTHADAVITDEQGRVHDIRPGWHGQKPTWCIINECEVLAEDEVEECIDSYTEYLTDNSNSADQWGTDFAEQGFKRLPEAYEAGHHPGQNDDPEAIMARLHKSHDHVIFSIDNTGQFDTHFSVWVK